MSQSAGAALYAHTHQVSAHIITDPPTRTESPPLPRPRIAIHFGRSVYMVCQHGRLKHRGWGVHGDIDVIPAGTPCVWEPQGHDTALIVCFDPALLAATAEEIGARGARNLELLNRFQVRDPQIENICWALKAEMEADYPNGRIFLDSLVTALAAALVRSHSSLVPAPSAVQRRMSGQRLRRTLSYIEDNLKNDLTLPEIARAAGVSVSQLKNAFRETTGVPVHQYVIQRRVDRAKTLLCESNLLVTDIAHETGFAHQSHLANHMRRLMGVSPKALRQLKG